MAPMSPERRHVRSRIAVVTRDNPTSPELTDLRREFAALKIEDYIREVVASAPPLTQAQIDRLSVLLNAPAPGGDSK
jgi:hypothetical protein